MLQFGSFSLHKTRFCSSHQALRTACAKCDESRKTLSNRVEPPDGNFVLALRFFECTNTRAGSLCKCDPLGTRTVIIQFQAVSVRIVQMKLLANDVVGRASDGIFRRYEP